MSQQPQVHSCVGTLSRSASVHEDSTGLQIPLALTSHRARDIAASSRNEGQERTRNVECGLVAAAKWQWTGTVVHARGYHFGGVIGSCAATGSNPRDFQGAR
jgi:hypothetical protein